MRFLVTFISPKRSARTLQVASEHARATGAEIIVLKVVPDAHKVGVIAELIATDRPVQKATEQVTAVTTALTARGIASRGVVRVDEVAEGIVRSALEWQADAVYVGTFWSPQHYAFIEDPIVRHVLDHCAANVVLVRQYEMPETSPATPPAYTTATPPAYATAAPPAPAFEPLQPQRKGLLISLVVFILLWVAMRFGNTHNPTSSEALTQATALRLVDWHISGLWIINSPVAWVKVTNYNEVPIKDVTFSYTTYTSSGKVLDTGSFEIEGTIAPHATRNFVELYLGLVSLESERLSIKLTSVKHA